MFKLRNETKVGILAIIAIAAAIWGYKFLKGVNILTSSQTFYVRYPTIDQLRPSSPIFISGLQVGMVKDIYVDPVDDKSVVAVLNVERDIQIPKDATAAIVGLSLMGGKAIEIMIPHPCDGSDCAQSGDYLQGVTRSLAESLLGDPHQLDIYMERLQTGLTSVYDSIADPNDPKGLGRSLVALQTSLLNIAQVTANLNRLLLSSSAGFTATANNAAEITRSLKDSNQDISKTLANLSVLSQQLKEAGLDKTSAKAAAAIDSITVSVGSLRSALNATEKTIGRVDLMAKGITEGKGAAGKLMTDEELYDNLVRTSRHLHLLAQDLRLNPKRYTTVKLKVFGKNKTKGYANPLEDPAYQHLVDSLEADYSRRVKNN